MLFNQNVKKIRYVQYLAALSASLSMCCCGLYRSWSSPSLPQLTSEDSPTGTALSYTEASFVASAYLMGYIPGGVISGWLITLVGPKTAIIISAIPTAVPWFIIVFAKSTLTLCIARFVAGIGSSVGATAATVYISEISDKDIRGKLGSTISIMYCIGCLFALSVGPFVSYTTLALSCSSFSILLLATFWIMPDSPYFLIKKNQTERANKTLVKLSSHGCDENSLQLKFNEVTKTVENDMKNSSKFWELFSKPVYRKRLVILSGVKAIQQLSGSAAIEVYMQTIIGLSKSSISPEHSSIIYGVIQILTVFLVAALVDRLGRKPLFIISSLGCAISLSIEGTYFYIYNNAPQINVDTLTWLPTTGVVLFAIMFSAGNGPLPTVIVGEIFPTNIKGHAMSFFIILGGAFSVFVVLIFDPISKTFGMSFTFFIFTAFCILGTIFICVVLPETKGKSFMEISDKFITT